jgi:hypothetical protein
MAWNCSPGGYFETAASLLAGPASEVNRFARKRAKTIQSSELRRTKAGAIVTESLFCDPRRWRLRWPGAANIQQPAPVFLRAPFPSQDMSGTELESASKHQPQPIDRSRAQVSHLRFFLGISTLWLALLIVLLRLESNPWLIAPLAIAMALLSLVAWRIHQSVGLAEQSGQAQKPKTKDGGQSNALLGGGYGAAYLVVALASLYFGGLSFFHGDLPGWPIAPKPAEPAAAAIKNVYSGLNSPPPYNTHNSYPAPNYISSVTPAPGSYPRPAGSYPQNGMPLRASGITPPPRPYSTPPIARPFPSTFPPGVFPGASPVPAPGILPPAATAAAPVGPTGNQIAPQPGQALPSSGIPTSSPNTAAPASPAPAVARSSSPAASPIPAKPGSAHPTTPARPR